MVAHNIRMLTNMSEANLTDDQLSTIFPNIPNCDCSISQVLENVASIGRKTKTHKILTKPQFWDFCLL